MKLRQLRRLQLRIMERTSCRLFMRGWTQEIGEPIIVYGSPPTITRWPAWSCTVQEVPRG